MANHRVNITAKPIVYKNDGTGRDTYISRFNGGLMGQNLMKALEPILKKDHEVMRFLTANSKNPKRNYRLPIKTTRYYGDGTGRDHIVIESEGGQCNPYRWQDQGERPFWNSLRSPDPLPVPKVPVTDPKLRRVMSANFFRQSMTDERLAEPKKQVRPASGSRIPNITNAYKIYKSYQDPKYQTMAKVN